MTKRTKYTAEEKYEILNAYDNGIGTIKEISNKYKINRATFYNWRYSYSKFGIDRLRESKTFKGYSKELKLLINIKYQTYQYCKDGQTSIMVIEK